ncbi:MAG: lysophospholipid acyltransferase family protein [Oligoflexia bacterium]|nr:lysophospholipid acyltransferase family protein [Oligoflexia bacterium]
MKAFFEKKSKIFDLKTMDRDALLYKVMPRFILEIIRKYFRLEVEGLENIPKRGRGLIIPNHSGYSGFDAFMLGNEIRNHTGRIARILAHHLWFIHKSTTIPLEKMGITEATMNNGLELLKKNNLIILFPEGEYGNFKPTRKRYRLQEFKRGFVRMAIMTKSPIIPTLVIGAEETHINLSQLKFTKYLIGTVLPLPLNIIPLPAKWKIKFLEPITLDYPISAAEDRALVHKISQQVRERIQFQIDLELKSRSYIYLR